MKIRGARSIHEAEQLYSAFYGELLVCASCRLQPVVNFQETEGEVVPDGFVYVPEGLPAVDPDLSEEDRRSLPHGGVPCHICEDCYRVHSGLTVQEAEAIVNEIEQQTVAGEDPEVAIPEACQIWAGVNLPFSGNEPAVWKEIEEQIREGTFGEEVQEHDTESNESYGTESDVA